MLARTAEPLPAPEPTRWSTAPPSSPKIPRRNTYTPTKSISVDLMANWEQGSKPKRRSWSYSLRNRRSCKSTWKASTISILTFKKLKDFLVSTSLTFHLQRDGSGEKSMGSWAAIIMSSVPTLRCSRRSMATTRKISTTNRNVSNIF